MIVIGLLLLQTGKAMYDMANVPYNTNPMQYGMRHGIPHYHGTAPLPQVEMPEWNLDSDDDDIQYPTEVHHHHHYHSGDLSKQHSDLSIRPLQVPAGPQLEPLEPPKQVTIIDIQKQVDEAMKKHQSGEYTSTDEASQARTILNQLKQFCNQNKENLNEGDNKVLSGLFKMAEWMVPSEERVAPTRTVQPAPTATRFRVMPLPVPLPIVKSQYDDFDDDDDEIVKEKKKDKEKKKKEKKSKKDRKKKSKKPKKEKKETKKKLKKQSKLSHGKINCRAGSAILHAMADTLPASRSLLSLIVDSDCSPHDPDCLQSALTAAKRKCKKSKKDQKQLRIALTTISVYLSGRLRKEKARRLLDRVIPKRHAQEHWAFASILRTALRQQDPVDQEQSLDAFNNTSSRYKLAKGAEYTRAQMLTAMPRDDTAQDIIRGVRNGLSPRWDYSSGDGNLTVMVSNIVGSAVTNDAEVDSGADEVADFIDHFNR